MWEYTKARFKENVGTFSKNWTTQENFRISRLKKGLPNLYKKENIKPEIKPILKIYKINFIN